MDMGNHIYILDNLGMELDSIPSTGETLPGAKQGSLAWRPFIILYTFAYKFISKLPQLNENAPSTPPLYRGAHHKNNTHPASVLEHL
jgi:hypothetical protein